MAKLSPSLEQLAEYTLCLSVPSKVCFPNSVYLKYSSVFVAQTQPRRGGSKKKTQAGSITRREANRSVVYSEDRAVSPKSWWDSCGKERREKNFLPDLHSDLRNAVDAAPRAEAITHARTQTHLFNAVLSAGPPSTYRALLYIDVGPNARKKEPSAHVPPPTASSGS